jgi:hypothetical protein
MRPASKPKPGRKESGGMTTDGRPGKPNTRFSIPSHRSWKSRCDSPHSHRSDDETDGKVDNQNQVFHFPTATDIFSYAASKQKRRRASPSPKKVLKK